MMGLGFAKFLTSYDPPDRGTKLDLYRISVFLLDPSIWDLIKAPGTPILRSLVTSCASRNTAS